MSTKEIEKDALFMTKLNDQRQAVDKLIHDSKADGDYYFYLIMSGFIATFGLLNNNPVIIIGAMLIAPALFPILSLGMALVTSSKIAIWRATKAIGMSFLIVVLSSALLTFLFQTMLESEPNQSIILASSPNITSIFIALISGLIASYSWVKQSQSALLPGVAVAVSLVPPLSNIGIGITLLSPPVFTGSLLLFILNLIGICLSSVLIFSIFGFSNLKNWQSMRLKQEQAFDSELKTAIHEKITKLDNVDGDVK